MLAAVLALAAGVCAGAEESTGTAEADKGELYRLPPEKLKQAQALGRIRPALHFGEEAWEIGALALLLATGGARGLGRWAERRTGKGKARVRLQAALFALVLAGGLALVVDLPFAAVGHAYSRLYGISVESWPAWAADEAKMLGLTLAVVAQVLLGVVCADDDTYSAGGDVSAAIACGTALL